MIIVFLLFQWDGRESLNTTQIFAIFEVLIYMRINVIDLSWGLGLYKESVVVLDRNI